MTDRGVSAVVDAALCLLLVTGAVATLAYLPADPGPSRANAADETADALGASTERVNYTLTVDGRELERSAQGTLAELLADAAVANATAWGRPISPASAAYVDRATAAVAAAVARPNASVAVRATWEPYPGSPVRGAVSAGDPPPQGADVHVATLRVPSGGPPGAAAEPTGDGYRSVARATATGVVATLFPPATTALSLSDPATAPLTAARYDRIDGALGTVAVGPGPGTRRDVARANGRLADALTEQFARDFEAGFESPHAAASAVAVGEVRIVVRVWER
ncbi:DUF7284 family protein [Halostella litorea]|uniref:DUF7284 family protein n=1 Tax=Halostella litorea TaxID=2528831 RepID=UPI001091FD69|nr:hypothetical protein [Halostella litorea]